MGADIGLTNANDTSAAQGTSIAAWDLSVRASATSTTNITGQVFTYAYDAFTGGNGLPVDSDIYITTLDGYEYKTSLNYLDPDGFMVYGNSQGFLAPDGSILDHDVLGTTNSGQLTGLAAGTNFAKAQYPISFSGPLDNATLNALGIPTTPVVYSINSISFSGTASGNTSTLGTGGNFTFDASSSGVYQLVIASNPTTPNFDPTLSTNRVLRGVAHAGVNTVTWDGNDNVGTPFPVGTAYPVQATFQNGEYHFPLLDAENSVLGGPSFTLINPPDGICPFGNTKCTTGFYDDRGYFAPGTGGGDVGTPGVELCGDVPPATAYSNPVTGFDSTSTQRAWGTQTGGNTNKPCQLNSVANWGSFGDVKGLDFWTYFPQPVPQKTTLNVVAAPPTLTVVKASTAAVITSVGQVVPYTFLVTNSGTSTLNNITVTDTQTAPSLNGSLSAISCPSSTLAAGAHETCTASYTVTAADVANGSVADSATVTGTPSSGPSVTSLPSVLSIPVASLTIQKTANPTAVSAAGQLVTYSFKVTNTGSSDLTGVTVNDTQVAPSLNGSLSAITCPSSTLATGLSEVCTATYMTTQADVDNGRIQDSATASGTPSQGGSPITSAPSAATVAVNQTPSIGLVKSASPTSFAAPGTVITYSYKVTNTGNVTLTDVGVSDPMPGLSSISCPSATLAPGGTETCTATYTTTQADVNAGAISNTGTATGTPPSGPPVTKTSTVTLPASQTSSISLVKTASITSYSAVGTPVTYSYKVTNTGNVTLTSVGVSDPMPGLSSVSCPAATPASRCERDVHRELHDNPRRPGQRLDQEHRYRDGDAADGIARDLEVLGDGPGDACPVDHLGEVGERNRVLGSRHVGDLQLPGHQ